MLAWSISVYANPDGMYSTTNYDFKQENAIAHLSYGDIGWTRELEQTGLVEIINDSGYPNVYKARAKNFLPVLSRILTYLLSDKVSYTNEEYKYFPILPKTLLDLPNAKLWIPKPGSTSLNFFPEIASQVKDGDWIIIEAMDQS